MRTLITSIVSEIIRLAVFYYYFYCRCLLVQQNNRQVKRFFPIVALRKILSAVRQVMS